MAKSSTPGSVVPPQGNTTNVAHVQSAFPPAAIPTSVNHAPSAPSQGQSGMPFGTPSGSSSFAGLGNFASLPPQQQANPGAPPPLPPPANEITPQQIQVLQVLQAQGVPPDQWATVLQALAHGANFAPPPPNANVSGQSGRQANAGYGGGRNDQSRDFGGVRSPADRFRNRSRSRSPPHHDRRRDGSPRRRRDSPVYGEYNADVGRDGGRSDGGRYGRGRDQANGYGQSNRQMGSSTPPRPTQDLPPPGPRWIDHEASLQPNQIKGSKTLSPLVAGHYVLILT